MIEQALSLRYQMVRLNIVFFHIYIMHTLTLENGVTVNLMYVDMKLVIYIRRRYCICLAN